MKKITALLIACASLFTLASCAQIKDAVSGIVPTPDTESAKTEKQNAYIDLYNSIVNDLDGVVYGYVDEFGSEDEIYIEDSFSGFITYTNLPDVVDKAAEFAAKAPSMPGPDAAMSALAPALKEYAGTLRDAKKYYEDKNFVDDDFAKAQEYHTIIIGQYDAVWLLIEDFLTAMDEELEGRNEEELAEFLEAGDMIHYNALRAMFAATKMSNYFYDYDITAENISDISLEEFRPLYDEFASAYSDYDAVVGGDSNAGKDWGIMTLSWFNSAMSDLKSSAAALVNMLQNGETFSDTDIRFADMRDGTPESIDKLTSELYSSYNSWLV